MSKLGQIGQLATRHAWIWRQRPAFADRSSAGRQRLLVDVSAIMTHDAQTGIQRVVRAVWSELRRRSQLAVEVVPVYATSSRGYCYAPADFLESRPVSIDDEPVGVRAGDKFLGLDLSSHLLPKYRRQLRAWRAQGSSVHIVVYDLLPLERPEWFTSSAVGHFRKWFQIVASEADQAICISNHVASDLRKRLERRGAAHNPLIARVRLGSDMAASVPSTGLCDDVKRTVEHLRFRPAILMVGTVEPRKGYEAALAAFDVLWRTRPDSPDLILVGKPGWKTGEIQEKIRSHPEFNRRVHWFDRMSDEGLCLLYDTCRGLLMASRGEGWGLPLVEAAMHRRYVLARDIPVFREHGLPNVLYFADDSPPSLGRAIMNLVNIGRHPAPPAALPTWSECVDELLATIGITEAGSSPQELQLRKAS